MQWLPAGPGPRTWSKLFWDSNIQRLTLLGGAAGGGYKMDIWHFNAGTGTWTPYLQPAKDCPGYLGFSAPDGRDAHGTLYDPVNDAYWSVAGSGYKCGNAGESSTLPVRSAGAGTTTTVIYDPALAESTVDYWKHWTVMVDNYYTAYVTGYDPTTKKLTLSNAIPTLAPGKAYVMRVWTDGQTWMFSKSTGKWTGFEGPFWGAITPSPVVNPPFRHTPGFAWSTADNLGVFFGGGRNSGGSNDVWVLNPVTKRWTQKLPNVATSSAPPQLMELTNNFVYDETNDVFVVFGGRAGNGQPTGETWTYKLSTNTWTKRVTSVSPPARMLSAMYYDASIGKVVMFGGVTVDIYNVVPTAAAVRNDLWVFDAAANTWTQITTPSGPSARYLHMMGYDPIAQIGVMYAGSSLTGFQEMWTLKFTQQVPNTPPSAVATVSPASGNTATSFSFSGAGSSDPGGNIISYVWNFGDGTANGSGVTSNHTFSTPGTYPVTLTVTDNLGLTASTTVSVSVVSANTAPTAVASVSPATGTTSTVFAFSGTSSSDAEGPIATYTWDFGDASGGTGVSASHAYAAAGTYTATLTVKDSAGLTATSSVAVTVSAPPPILGFKRTIYGTIANGSVTRVLAGGVSVPFTASGSAYSADITATTPGAVSVSIEYSGPGGSGAQPLSVVVP